ncbi:MAG: DEAD/DEAH box helicase, partial [Bradymonadaceae bacterium]
LASKGRAILADDMGLGKTLQAIAAATWLTHNEGVRHSLIVCPASLKHQWKQEIERFTDFNAEVVGGRPDDRVVQYKRRPRFAIMNYALVRRDWEKINEHLAPDLLMLDEAQRIKNWETKTADTIKALETEYAFVLTGTPLENRLEDLYSLMQVVDERVLGPLWRYIADFHVTDQQGNVVGYRNLSELRRRIEPVMLRRDRREVQDQLPDRVDTRLAVELGERQRQLHNAALSNASQISQIRRERSLTPTERNRLMAALQQARMACDGAQLVDEDTEQSPKLDELENLLEQLCVDGGRKVVVFSEWKKMTSRAVERAEKLDLGVVELTGDVPTSKRGELLERFDEEPSAQVFVSTDAGGTGLNLQSASVVINLDIPWNPATLEQRIGRVHRLGQSETVQVVLMIAANSYEERVASLVGQKQSLFDNVVVGDDPDDAVGLSKDAMEWIDESLDDTHDVIGGESPEKGGPGRSAGEEDPEPVSEQSAPEPPTEPDPRPDDEALSDEQLNRIVAELDDRLGDRIERLMATGGGLVAVVDEIDEYVDAATAAISDDLEVVALDAETGHPQWFYGHVIGQGGFSSFGVED